MTEIRPPKKISGLALTFLMNGEFNKALACAHPRVTQASKNSVCNAMRTLAVFPSGSIS